MLQITIRVNAPYPVLLQDGEPKHLDLLKLPCCLFHALDQMDCKQNQAVGLIRLKSKKSKNLNFSIPKYFAIVVGPL